jgi:aryl-alcohol dehydrogenase (NADP+)
MSEIDYRYLGRSGLKVSPLCLGAMMFGGETDEATSAKIVASAAERGINFIDTADAYHGGKSEEVVGRCIAPTRDKWVLATKLGYGGGADDGANARGLSRKWIVQAAEASLKRLGTDYIDVLYFHRTVADAPLEESLRAVRDLIAQGKVRYLGLSNFRGWRIAEVCRLADAIGMDRPVVSQPLYNLVDRTAEAEQLPAAAHYGLGVASYSPLARGVLSGKYTAGGPPPEGSRAARGDARMMQTEWRAESFAVAKAVEERAAELGLTTIQLAVGWVLRNRIVSAAIVGPRTLEQWNAYAAVLDAELGPEIEAFVDELVHPGHSSTPGHTDPAYPIEGRVPR